MDNLKEVMLNRVSRRKFISGVSAGMGAAAAVSFAAGCGGSSTTTVSTAATTTVTTTVTTTASTAPTSSTGTSGVTDADILTFALNLEYLEASYYLIGTTGAGLSATDMGPNPGSVTGGTQVSFGSNTTLQYYANEIAQHELAHVRFLRAALTAAGVTPVSMPNIDLMNSFNAAASAATIGPSFNPFDSPEDFVLGAFVFEDVGVTAYHGAAPLITTPAYLEAAGGIYAVEAYHAGIVRTTLLDLGGAYVTNANLISNLRGAASAAPTSGTSGAAETMLTLSSVTASMPPSSLAYDRNTDQVLHIVYLNATAGVVSSGGFFPNGLAGTITASAS